ncbi:MAG TPA: ATP-binding cassette domain-containing protein, partial [Candidatus Atribacteria bacterium]|nr:ATP-binding cassette domain-containing protein [Candidatus Atribacteria bacterium]
MLEIKELGVRVGGEEVLQDVNLEIGPGEVHILLGPNGAGKTTLLMAIMGMPGYEVTRGDILFQGESILPLTVEERAKMGIGMAFQKMPVIPGVKLRTLGEIIVNGGSSLIEEVAEKLNCTYLLERSIGLGFSGGEAKRAELFQLFLQRPLLSLIDEPESGVDLDNIALIGKALSELLEREQV